MSKNEPTIEELKELVASMAAELLMFRLSGLSSGPTRKRNKRPTILGGDALDIIGKLIGQDDEATPPEADGEKLSYAKKSLSGEVTTLYLSPGIELPIEIIGTHESHCSLTPIQSQATQGGGLVWEVAGKEVERGYYEAMLDGSIFACIEGLHIRISITALFQAILSPEMRNLLSLARDQFNEQNGAAGKTHYFDGTH